MKKHILIAMMLLVTGSLAAQQEMKTVKGCVKDAGTGKPLAGVIVAAYGDTRYSTMTDEEGRYELKAPAYTRSVLMRIDGYNLNQQAVADDTADAVLYLDAFRGQYNRTTNATLGSKATQFDNTSEFGIDPLIRQQLGADIHASSRSGVAGLGNVMFIGGLNSLNANAQPLIVLDGVLMDMQYDRSLVHEGYYNNLLANLSPNDIENVQVLKNGTALYGAKGANGVILINTKRNKSMATKIDVTINGRYELEPRLPQMMSAAEYRLYATEMLATKTTSMAGMKFLNADPDNFYYNQYHNHTDWKSLIYDNAFSQNYGINVQGGDAVASYNLSVGYALGKTTLKNNDFSRFNMRLNTDIEVFRGFTIRFDASYSDVDRSLRDDGAPADPLDGVITSPGFLALAKSPFLSQYAYDKYGNRSHYLAEADDYLEGMFQNKGRLANPVSILENGEGKNRNSFGNRLITFAITPKYQINKSLSVSEHFVMTLVNTNENYYLPQLGVPQFTVKGLEEDRWLKNIAQSLASRQTAIQSDTRVAWQHRYGKHLIGLTGGARLVSNEYSLLTQKGYNTPNDKQPNMSGSLTFKSTDGADSKTREVTWYGLADYNLAETYYLHAGLSAQTSSRFGDEANGLKLFGVVWGLFPSVEAAWVMSNEKWLAGVKGIDYLRLNVGFDVTGNDALDYTASRTYFVANNMLDNTADGLSLGNIGNTELQWETTRRLTAGLEGNFMGNRLNVRFNFFKSWTSNLLALRQLAWTSGLSQSWTNGGKLENQGFDVSVNAKVLALKDFSWEVGVSAGHYHNEVTALPDNNKPLENSLYGATIRTEVGQPLGMFYGWRTEGVYKNTEEAQADGYSVVQDNGENLFFEAGDMRFYDKDDNQVIDDKDRVVIGNPNPDIYGNLFTTLQWKNLRLSATFDYSLGNDIYNYQRSLLEGGYLFVNQTTALRDRWTTENQVTAIPRVSYKDPLGNARFSDRWIEDGSYLRLSNVTLSYYIPIQSTYLQGLTVWGSANNLFTLTRYLGGNPDCSASGSALFQGIDRGCLPTGRSFALGVNINL